MGRVFCLTNAITVGYNHGMIPHWIIEAGDWGKPPRWTSCGNEGRAATAPVLAAHPHADDSPAGTLQEKMLKRYERSRYLYENKGTQGTMSEIFRTFKSM